MIHKRGYWLAPQPHHFDKPLAAEILALIKPTCKAVLDLGCGSGAYVTFFREQDMPTIGYDGSPLTTLYNCSCIERDLSEPLQLPPIYDWVLSLEVGEHIPKEYEQVFLDNICKNAKVGVVLSWAIPEQIGLGHVNCQTNEYIEEQMKQRGFTRFKQEEQPLRDVAVAWWFKNTVMVYRKNTQ